MKIIEINTTKNSGSTGRIASQIQKYVNDKGALCKIAFGYGNDKDLTDFSMYSWVGTHIHSFLSRKLCMQGRCSWFQTYRLVRFLKEEKPDIVHLHNIHGHYLNYGILFRYLKSVQIPVIWTFHDCWPYTGKCAHYSSAGCDKWKTECFDCPNLQTYPDSSFDGSRRNYQNKKSCFTNLKNLHIVCNSDWLKSQVEESFFKEREITRIYNGVDTGVFYPKPANEVRKVAEKYRIELEKKTILGVSSVWKADKGLQVFLKLAQAIPSEYQVVLVGVSHSQKEMLPKSVVAIERTEDMQELAALYTLADVLVNASKEETFGMVAVEAMSCGIPVVVSSQTACPEIVDQSVGLVVSMDSIDELRGAIEEICTKGKGAYSERCMFKVRNLYSVEEMNRQYYSLYRRVLAMEQAVQGRI